MMHPVQDFFTAMGIAAIVAFAAIGIVHTGLMLFDPVYAKAVRSVPVEILRRAQ